MITEIKMTRSTRDGEELEIEFLSDIGIRQKMTLAESTKDKSLNVYLPYILNFFAFMEENLFGNPEKQFTQDKVPELNDTHRTSNVIKGTGSITASIVGKRRKDPESLTTPSIPKRRKRGRQRSKA